MKKIKQNYKQNDKTKNQRVSRPLEIFTNFALERFIVNLYIFSIVFFIFLKLPTKQILNRDENE